MEQKGQSPIASGTLPAPRTVPGAGRTAGPCSILELLTLAPTAWDPISYASPLPPTSCPAGTHGLAWHGVAWHGMVWHRMAWCGMAWNSMAAASPLCMETSRTCPHYG